MKSTSVKHIRLKASQKEVSVPIYIGEGIISKIHSLVKLDSYSRIGILTDSNVAKHWGKTLQNIFGKEDVLITIPAGEDQKNLATVQNIWATMLQHKFDRKSLLICVGGGVVCDTGAFAASTYMRGISFVNAPTTLLAQTDAAIGGKTGVNFGDLKNMIGTFAQPEAVICDVQFLSTLPKREYLSGFAEVIKHSLISDAKFFNYLAGKDLSKLNHRELEDVLHKSCSIKCDVVSSDINEKNRRKILNFGHTIGHAIEIASHETNKPLLHGEAVAIGIIAEARLSLLAGLISDKEFVEIETLIIKTDLPVRVSQNYEKKILEKIVLDKKNVKQKIKWVLLKGIGESIIDEEQPERLIKEAIEYVLA
jgi:3-dehydroquinate synthase